MTRGARRPTREEKRRRERYGRTAETIAVLWLSLRGHRILGRRLRTPVGEVDLLAERGRTIVVVEVKARASRTAGLEALGPHQRRRLEQAAAWLTANRHELRDRPIRFDLVIVRPWRLPCHLSDAWRPGLVG